MTIYHLLTPNADHLGILGDRTHPTARCRIIFGVGYTEDSRLVDYARDHGWTVEEIDEVPEVFAAWVARLDAWPFGEITLAPHDVADPDPDHHLRFRNDHQVNTHGPDVRFSTPTHLDIRDVLSGALTAA